MKLVPIALTIILILSTAACGGGGGSTGGNGNTSSSGGNTSSSGGSTSQEYSVNLSRSSAEIRLPFDSMELVSETSVNVTYVGDGLLVSYAPGQDEVFELQANFSNVSTNSATLHLSFDQYARHENPGTYPVVLRVYSGDQNGENYAWKDLTVNIVQEDGVATHLHGIYANIGVLQGVFDVLSGDLDWEIPDVPGFSFNPNSGTGRTTVTVSYVYPELPEGESLQAIEVIGRHPDGGEQVDTHQFNITVLNMIELDNWQDLYIHGYWGSEGNSDSFNITTGLSHWTITSDIPGLAFEPSSGSGSLDNILVNYSDNTPVGDYSGQITVQSGTVSENINLNLSVYAPNIASRDNSGFFNIDLARNIYAPEDSQVLSLAYDNGADANYSLSELPSWLVAEQSEGLLSESIVLSLHPEETSDAVFNGEFKVTLELPGHSEELTYSVQATIDQFRLRPSSYTYAFSDYNTNEDHQALLSIDNLDELSEEFNLQFTSAQDWLLIDSSSQYEANFSLDTSNLADDMYYGKITVSSDNPLIIPVDVEVGYYKSSIDLGNTASAEMTETYDTQTIDSQTIGVDSLGPWLYAFQYATNQIEIFNMHTGTFEAPWVLSELPYIYETRLSSDGKFLAILSEDSTLYAYNLRTREFIGSLSEFSYPIEFIRVNQEILLKASVFPSQADGISADWFKAKNLSVVSKINFNHDLIGSSIELFPSRNENGVWALDRNNSSCYLSFVDLEYRPTLNSINIGDSINAAPNCSFSMFSRIGDNKQHWAMFNDTNNSAEIYSNESSGTILNTGNIYGDDNTYFTDVVVSKRGKTAAIVSVIDTSFQQQVRIYENDLLTYEQIDFEDDHFPRKIHVSSDGKIVSYFLTNSDLIETTIHTLNITQ